ncbi:MAG TPA: hypothetical protein VF267_10230 [Gammaproteobacteria bacterium]
MNVIKARHPDPYTRTTPAALGAKAQALKDATGSNSDDEMLLGLAELVSLVNDGHTLVTSVYTSFELASLRFAWFQDGFYAVEAPAELHAALAGRRLTMIGGIPIDDVADDLAHLVPGETEIMAGTRVSELLAYPAILAARGFAADSENAQYFFDGNSSPVVMAASLSPPVPVVSSVEHDLPMSFLDQDSYYWAGADPDRSLLYVQYNRCAEDPGYPFPEFVEDVIRIIEREPVDRVLIDLRNNSGGDSTAIEPLVSALSSSRLHAPGKVYVAIGPYTFSSAILNAKELQWRLDATLIGSSTGEWLNHFGEVKFRTLPNTHVRISYSTEHFLLAPDGDGPLIPDIELPYLGSDFTRGVDPVLDYFDTR